MSWRRSITISSLEEHPNLPEIIGILSQLPHLCDEDLRRLSAAWNNTVFLAEARAKALTPDSPLVVEVLAAFDAVQAMYADDLAGEADYCALDPHIASVALKAVRDAIAAAYARPTLTRSEHGALMRAWHEVFPTVRLDEPDLGPRAEEIKAILAAMPLLATRCHDAASSRLFDEMLTTSWVMDEDVRTTARDEAWAAAVLTARRHVWELVRRSGAEGIGRPCPVCGRHEDENSAERVLELALDAACGLLVADAVDDNLLDVLTMPVRSLIPAQRKASS